MTDAQKIDIMDTTHVMTTRMERAIARWFKAQPLRETQAETPVKPRVEDLAMQARAAALEEAALLVESRCDMPEELAAIERLKAAAQAAMPVAPAAREAIATAYAYLWCVHTTPRTLRQYPPERAAHEARKLLRDMLTKEERGEAINRVLQSVFVATPGAKP